MSRYNARNAVRVPIVSDAPFDSTKFFEDVKRYQKEHNLKVDGLMGPSTAAHARELYLKTSCPKKISKIGLSKIISKFEGKFWSCNRDSEFKGRFDRGDRKHWASGKVHIGLSFGFIQFTQDGGSLGKLLKLMKAKNPEKFVDIFGPHSDELVKVTNRIKGVRIKGRSRRVQKVGGHDLWDDYWIPRFVKAGKDEEFQDCQLDLASRAYLEPAIKHCKRLGITSERGLAMMYDRCIQHGPGRAPKLFRKKPNEFETLWDLYARNKDERWGHRPLKLWKTEELSDQAFTFA